MSTSVNISTTDALLFRRLVDALVTTRILSPKYALNANDAEDGGSLLTTYILRSDADKLERSLQASSAWPVNCDMTQEEATRALDSAMEPDQFLFYNATVVARSAITEISAAALAEIQDVGGHYLQNLVVTASVISQEQPVAASHAQPKCTMMLQFRVYSVCFGPPPGVTTKFIRPLANAPLAALDDETRAVVLHSSAQNGTPPTSSSSSGSRGMRLLRKAASTVLSPVASTAVDVLKFVFLPLNDNDSTDDATIADKDASPRGAKRAKRHRNAVSIKHPDGENFNDSSDDDGDDEGDDGDNTDANRKWLSQSTPSDGRHARPPSKKRKLG